MKAELWWAVVWDDGTDKIIFVRPTRFKASGLLQAGMEGVKVEPVSVVLDGGKLVKEGKG